MKIYDFPLSPNCRKVRAIVYELGLTRNSSRSTSSRGISASPRSRR
jgi:glutathione S-transferase